MDKIKENLEKNKKEHENKKISLIEKDFYRIIVIGPTGAGKSQFCNFIMRDTEKKSFEVSESLNSCTQDPKSKIFKRLKSKTKYEIIDTAGDSDSSDNDKINLEKLVKFLREKKEIDCIALLLKFNERISGPTRKYIKLLGDIFTAWEFYSHLCVFFTRSPIVPKKKQESMQKKYKEEINIILKECFKMEKNVHFPEIKVFFIDTEYDEDEQKYEEKFQDTVDIMLQYMKVNVYRFNSINTSKLDIEGERTSEEAINRTNTCRKLSEILMEQTKKYNLEQEIEEAKKNNNLELIKKKEEELNLLQKKGKVPNIDEESMQIYQQYKEREKECIELLKEISEEAKEKNIHIEELDDSADRYSDIAKKLGIGGATTFLLGLGGVAATSICPLAGPVIAAVCFTGSGGFTLGSIGYKIASIFKRNK